MRELVRFEKYSRKEIHDIFSPDTTFTKGAGYWGISGIIKIPNTLHDYIFLVTYGQKQAEHEFDEDIDTNGILTWQSQPSQTLHTPQILELINHDYTTDNIYLFLRSNKKADYTYMGLLAYVEHDNQREKPVYFKWQILNWNGEEQEELIGEHGIIKYSQNNKINKKKEFQLILNEEEATYCHSSERQGKNTNEFYSNKNINFEGEVKKNTELGKRGEEIVVEYERSKLISEGREDLADKVRTTRDIAGNAERFDILSYDKDGNEKYIEVKTTKGGLTNIFHISESEVKFSHDYGEKYYLYRVYNLNTKTKSAGLKIIKGPIDREMLKPTNYICRIGGNNESI